jgi:hypothetical protein
MRWFLPVFVAVAFGGTAIVSGNWVFILQAAVIVGLALGFNNLVTMWSKKKIKKLERQIIGDPVLPHNTFQPPGAKGAQESEGVELKQE